MDKQLAQHRFDQPLRHRVGKAAIGSRRVRVIVRGQRKMSRRVLAASRQNVLARAISFTTAKETSA